jgi:hypothetical protein
VVDLFCVLLICCVLVLGVLIACAAGRVGCRILVKVKRREVGKSLHVLWSIGLLGIGKNNLSSIGTRIIVVCYVYEAMNGEKEESASKHYYG